MFMMFQKKSSVGTIVYRFKINLTVFGFFFTTTFLTTNTDPSKTSQNTISFKKLSIKFYRNNVFAFFE